MGLDMYLHASRRAYKYSDPEPLVVLSPVADQFLPPDAGNLQMVEITREVAYWRKANAIHGWFVTHCQDGVDECQESNVPFEKLVELRDLAQQALDTPGFEDAKQLLTPVGGFFFGATDNEEWYRSDLKDTVTMLTRIIEWDLDHRRAWDLAHRRAGQDYSDVAYTYRSSW